MKEKVCKVCRVKFIPIKPLQIVCGLRCAQSYAWRVKSKSDMELARAKRKEIRAKRESIKTRAQWMREAQQAFNAYRRELFRDEPCISCGRYHSGQYHAGHYMSTGAHPELRFEEINVWKQCQPCNTHLSGNLINYRKALINRIGVEKVDWLEGYHEPKKYSIDDLKSIAKEYRIKLANIRSNSNE